MQDSLATSNDPICGFLNRQFLNMDEMTLGCRTLPFERIAILKSIERIAGAGTVDYREADRMNSLRVEIQEDRSCGWLAKIEYSNGHVALLKRKGPAITGQRGWMRLADRSSAERAFSHLHRPRLHQPNSPLFPSAIACPSRPQ